MTKEEVLTNLRKPSSVSAEGNREVFVYEWDDRWDGAPGGKWAYVGFEDGKVVGYHVDHEKRSTSYNLAHAWVMIGSAPKTNIYINN